MRKVETGLCALTIIVMVFLSSCSYRHTEDILGNICDTSDTKYSTYIKGVIETRCNAAPGCHGASAGSISLETHAAVSGAVNEILNRIKNGSMPKGAPKLDDCTITKIQRWVNKGAQNN